MAEESSQAAPEPAEEGPAPDLAKSKPLAWLTRIAARCQTEADVVALDTEWRNSVKAAADKGGPLHSTEIARAVQILAARMDEVRAAAKREAFPDDAKPTAVHPMVEEFGEEALGGAP